VAKPTVEEAAAALYDPALPYHNFQHALSVAEEGRRIVDRCRAAGVAIDADVVHYACLLHDAGYREDHVARGFESKEAYSAHLASGILDRCGVDRRTAAAVLEAILSTHCDAHCASVEARAVRAADLSGLSGDFANFRDDARRLKREHEIMSGEEISWDRWREVACRRITAFLRERLDLTAADVDASGESLLVVRARENVRRLLAEPASQA
jgi:predicted metal-dependent HD superfamily phosphohydrolase